MFTLILWEMSNLTLRICFKWVLQPSIRFQDDLCEILVPKVLDLMYLIDSKAIIFVQNWRNVRDSFQGWLMRHLVSRFNPGK